MNESSYVDMANKLNQYLENYCGMNNNNTSPPEVATDIADVLTDLIHMNRDKEQNQEGGILMEEVIENLTGGDKEAINSNNTGKKDVIIETFYKSVDSNLLEGGKVDTVDEVEHEVDSNSIERNVEPSEANADYNLISEDEMIDNNSDMDLFEMEGLDSSASESSEAEQPIGARDNVSTENNTCENVSIENNTNDNTQTENISNDNTQTENISNNEEIMKGGHTDSDDSDDSVDFDYSDDSDDNLLVPSNELEDDDTQLVEYGVSEDSYEAFLKHYKDTELKPVFKGGDNAMKGGKIQIIPMFPYLLRY